MGSGSGSGSGMSKPGWRVVIWGQGGSVLTWLASDWGQGLRGLIWVPGGELGTWDGLGVCSRSRHKPLVGLNGRWPDQGHRGVDLGHPGPPRDPK
jgi:hypothetical protein